MTEEHIATRSSQEGDNNRVTCSCGRLDESGVKTTKVSAVVAAHLKREGVK